ncbi:VOC family protein [Mycobacterium sp. 050134]|uniref:VOC family protein n=1 Tax=Mycobacterium sp. 050134 TaxID=3096111 RepID=UPI002ED7880A
MRLDHVIIATNEPVRSARSLAKHAGLVAVEGGVHDGLGTANYIVPLGRGYLELVTVHDRKLAESNAFGRLVLAALRERDEAFAGWAVEVSADCLAATAQTRGLTTGRLTRRGIGIDHAGMEDARESPGLPFLLAREAGSGHPQGLRADHRVTPHGVQSLTIGESEDALNDWFAGKPIEPSVLCRGEGRGIHQVEIATGAGAVVLRGESPTRTAQS